MRLMIELAKSAAEDARLSESRPPETEPTGTVLGDYRILREIGRGGMGVVYEAEQISLGRRVALKVLPFAAMLDERQLKRFRNEARAAATLDHPHIVPVHAIGCERAVHFYAMSLVNGQTLAQVITDLRRSAQIEPDPAEGVRHESPSSVETGLDRTIARFWMLAYCRGTQVWGFNGVRAPLKEPKPWMPRFSLRPVHSPGKNPRDFASRFISSRPIRSVSGGSRHGRSPSD
jgi:hypothetical protein